MAERLRVAIVEDDGGVAATVEGLLQEALGKGTFYPWRPSKSEGTYDEAVEVLAKREFDLVVLDVKLRDTAGRKDREYYGGMKIEKQFREKFDRVGTKRIVYSSRLPELVDVIAEAPDTTWFPKAVGPDLSPVMVEALQRRAASLAAKCSVAEREHARGGSTEVEIDGKQWEVRSLCSPYANAAKAAGNEQLIIEQLFGTEWIRLLSYWFKGQDYEWPGVPMYGLSWGFYNHLGKAGAKSGVMDALTHGAKPGSSVFDPDKAMALATRECSVLRSLDEGRVETDVLQFLEKRAASGAGTFSNRFAFTLNGLSTKRNAALEVVPWSVRDWKKTINRKYYCGTTLGKNALERGFELLTESVATNGHCSDLRMVMWSADCLRGRFAEVGRLPEAWIAVAARQDGPVDAKGSQGWFDTGGRHSLAAVRGAVAPYVDWFIVGSNGRREPEWWWSPTGSTCDVGSQLGELWAAVKGNELTVGHMWRLKLPLLCLDEK